jgi:murein DD-endopeptidase MepM/ murein hydrolase activator NlpD
VPAEVGQGRTTIVRAPTDGAVAAEVDFAGRRQPLLVQDGVAWGVLGMDAFQEPAAYLVSVDLLAADGTVVTNLLGTLIVVDIAYPVEYITLPPDRAALLDPAIVQEEIDKRAAIFAAYTPQMLWAGPFILPVAGPVGSVYGAGRSYNNAPVIDYHHGTDFTVDAGTPVAAANSGRVAFAGPLAVRGNSVIIDHGLGVFSAYHHLSEIWVVEGQDVAKGDAVGAVGDTGLATGPHLHWEIIVGGVNVDPLPWTEAALGP